MKKLLSILAAVGLTATASTSAVACSSVFASGSLEIGGANDLTINYTKDQDNHSKLGLLDNYIVSKSDWRANNNSYAKQIKEAEASGDKDAINTAAWNVVTPIFSTVIKGETHYSLDATELYSLVHPDNTDAHDKATLTNKLNLKVQFMKLGEALHVLGVKDKDGKENISIADAIKVNVDDSDPLKNWVHINDMDAIKKTFNQNFNGGDMLQKILNRPTKELASLKVQISTTPKVVIDDNETYLFKSSDNKITLNGANLNLLTNKNTTLVNDKSGKKVNDLTFTAVREDYRSVDITVTSSLDAGTYTLTYDSGNGKLTVNITITE